MSISFEVTALEAATVEQIAERAERDIFSKYPGLNQSRLDTVMDLRATIAQGCPLRLDELLAAEAFDFAHDISGIRRFLNRKTGKLENHFLPRFARHVEEC